MSNETKMELYGVFDVPTGQLVGFAPIGPAGEVRLDELSAGSSESITGLVADTGADNTSVFQAKIDDLAEGNKVRAVVSEQGEYRLGAIDMPPAISLNLTARGGVFFCAKDNMPQLNADGAQNSLFRILALTPAFGGTRSWTSVYEGFNIDGRKGNQTYPITSIRVPNPDPSENEFDPDPNYTTNKDYASTRFRNIEITGSSGIGIDIEAGRGRAYLSDVRALNGNDTGIKISSNDFIIGHRCAAGGNTKTQIIAGGGSGGLLDGVNIWGRYDFRSKGCIAFKSNDTKGGSMNMCVLNDSTWFHGDTSSWRGWVLTGNLFEPHEEAFYADGAGIDIDNPTPGTEDPITQAAVSVDGYTNFVIGPNMWSRTPKTTRFNTNGNAHGNDGTAYKFLLDVSDGAHVNAEFPVSVIPRDRPWFDADFVPVKMHDAGSICNYRLHAIGTDYGLHRFGTRGQGATSHFMAGVAETSDRDPLINVWLGDPTRRNRINGRTEFGQGIVWMDTAFDHRSTADGGTRAISDKFAAQQLFTSGTIASYTITLPYIPNGSKRLLVLFTSGTITQLNWNTTRSDGTTVDAIGSGTDNFNDHTAGLLPSKIAGLTAVELEWRENTAGTSEWFLVSVVRRSDPWINLTFASQTETDARKSSNFKVTLTGNFTLKNPDNMIHGQRLRWMLTQDATGSRVCTYGNKFRLPGGAAANALSTTAGAIDMLEGVYDADLDLVFCTLTKAYAA